VTETLYAALLALGAFLAGVTVGAAIERWHMRRAARRFKSELPSVKELKKQRAEIEAAIKLLKKKGAPYKYLLYLKGVAEFKLKEKKGG